MSPTTQSGGEMPIDPTAQATSPTNPHTFLALPGELRNAIYRYIVVSSPPKIDISADSRRGPPPASTAAARRPFLKSLTGLAYANKQIYREFVPILVSQTGFVLHSSLDATRLGAFLTTLPLGASNPWHCIRQLAFPHFTEQIDGVRPSRVTLDLLRSCVELKDLCVTLSSRALVANSANPCEGALRRAQVQNHPHVPGNGNGTNEQDIGVNEDTGLSHLVTGCGLEVIGRLPKLERLRVDCEIAPGQGYTIDVFMQLREWIKGTLKSCGVKRVGERMSEFTNGQGQRELMVFMFTVYR